jgi:hypothetical protein
VFKGHSESNDDDTEPGSLNPRAVALIVVEFQQVKEINQYLLFDQVGVPPAKITSDPKVGVYPLADLSK